MRSSRSSYLLCFSLLAAGRPAAGENLVAAGQFDQPAAIDAWTVTPAGGEASMSFNASPDEAGCIGSGSAHLVASTPGSAEVLYSICAGGVAGGGEYAVGLEVFFPGAADDGQLTWGVTWFDGTDCTGNYQGEIFLGPVGYAAGWQPLEFWSSTPVEVASARVELRVSSGSAPGPLHLEIDRVFVRPVGDLFADDFELGESCRWSGI